MSTLNRTTQTDSVPKATGEPSRIRTFTGKAIETIKAHPIARIVGVALGLRYVVMRIARRRTMQPAPIDLPTVAAQPWKTVASGRAMIATVGGSRTDPNS